MPTANGLFSNGGWLESPKDIEFASKGAFRFREFKTELRDIFSCFLKPDYKGEFADDVIESRTLVDTGVAPGVYNNVTVNGKGQVISAELKNPLGDPIHSPGVSGFVDCGDIAGINVLVKGMSRVHIDEFGRVIEADCVTPTGPATGDGLTVDTHGRVTAVTFGNFGGRISTLETDLANLITDLGDVGSGSGYFDISGIRFQWAVGSFSSSEGEQTVNWPASFNTIGHVMCSTEYNQSDISCNAHFQIRSWNTSGITVRNQNDASGYPGSSAVKPHVIGIGTPP